MPVSWWGEDDMETVENNSATIKGKKGFQPGKSGNPGGRPKNNQELKEAFRAHTMEAKNVLVEVMNDKESKSGDRVRAAEVVLNRAWGTPEQSVAVSGGIATAEIDTSKLPKNQQDALLNALSSIFVGGNETESTD